MAIASASVLALPLTSSTVSLTADNTAVATEGVRLLLLGSNSSTATSRTFTLTASAVVGHLLTIVFTSGSSNTAQLQATGIQKLNADWTPLQYDTINLVSDGTNWIEMNRSANPALSTVSTVTLTADNTAVATSGINTILLGSDDTTAANRTFTLTASAVVGHRLVIVFTTGTSTTAQLADTGIQKLSAAWEPLQYDTIELISDGTNWIEVARADN